MHSIQHTQVHTNVCMRDPRGLCEADGARSVPWLHHGTELGFCRDVTTGGGRLKGAQGCERALRLGSGDPPKDPALVRVGLSSTPSQGLCVEGVRLGDPREVACPL